MELSQDLVLLGLGGLALLLVVVCMLILDRRNTRTSALREVEQQFAGVPIARTNAKAYFFGLDRSWDGQWRGYGVLVLTEEVLYFRSWQSKLDLSVPIDRIERVGIGSDKEKKGLRPHYLKVSYRGMDNQLRVGTWRVRRPQKWISLILSVRERNARHGDGTETEHLS